MKEKTLRVTKSTLSFLVVGLYIACCVDAFIHIQPYESDPVSFLSMIFSVLFFAAYILLLWFFRKNQGMLLFSLIISALLTIVIIYNWAQLPYSLEIILVLIALLAYAPFYGLSFFPFAQQDAGFPWVFINILALLFIYQLVLLILLKKDFYNKRRRQTNETT